MVNPPEVIHFNNFKGVSHKSIVTEIIDKFGLKEEEAKLLMLYGCCSNRFAPSKQYIENKTGILKEHVSRVRKKLVDDGFIEYSNENGVYTIYLDWQQLRDLASVPADKVGKKKTRIVAKVDHNWTPKYAYFNNKHMSDETKMMLFASEFWNIPLNNIYPEEDETFGMSKEFLAQKAKDAHEFFYEGGFEREFPEVAQMDFGPVPF